MKNLARAFNFWVTIVAMNAFIVFAALGFCALDRFAIVECLRYSILCLMCLFAMLAPVTFGAIIPKSDDEDEPSKMMA